jgi:hypothetical protein
MAADRIHIAEPAPPHCSGCFQQKPQTRHVDFSAAYDGPTVPALENTIGVVVHSIDDLVLCEDCIETAASLVGLTRAEALIAERDQLEASNRELVEKFYALENYRDKLIAALDAKPETPTLPGRPKRQAAKR